MCDYVIAIFWNNSTTVTAIKPINYRIYFMKSIAVVYLLLFDGIYLQKKSKSSK